MKVYLLLIPIIFTIIIGVLIFANPFIKLGLAFSMISIGLSNNTNQREDA